MHREDSKVCLPLLIWLAIVCLVSGALFAQANSYDGTGRLKVNANTSTVTVTNAPLTNFQFDAGALKSTNIGGITLTTNGLAQENHQVTQTELITRLSNVMTSAGIKVNSNLATEASLITLQTAAAALEQANRLSNTVKSTLTVQGGLNTGTVVASDHVAVLSGYATNGVNAWTPGTRVPLRVYPDGGLVTSATNVVAISAASLPLPSGAATETTVATLDTAAAALEQRNRLSNTIAAVNTTLTTFSGQNSNRLATLATEATLALQSTSAQDLEQRNRLSNTVERMHTTLTTFSGQNSNRLATISTETTLSTFSGQNSNRLATLDTAVAALEQNNRLSNMLVRIDTSLTAMTNGASIGYQNTVAGSVYSNVFKASAGRLFNIHVGNTNTQSCYAKAYNTASAFTPANNTPIGAWIVPGASTNGGSGSGNNITFQPEGVLFSTGIGIAITGGVATNDNTGPTGIYPVTVTYE